MQTTLEMVDEATDVVMTWWRVGSDDLEIYRSARELATLVVDAALAAAPRQAIDPSHAALVALVERLRSVLRDLHRDVMTAEGYGTIPVTDRSIENDLLLLPGDLGEGGDDATPADEGGY